MFQNDVNTVVAKIKFHIVEVVWPFNREKESHAKDREAYERQVARLRKEVMSPSCKIGYVSRIL